jgi:hypothetical protein
MNYTSEEVKGGRTGIRADHGRGREIDRERERPFKHVADGSFHYQLIFQGFNS